MNSLLRYQETDCKEPEKDEYASSGRHNFPMMLPVYSVRMMTSSYEDLTAPLSPPLASVPFQWEEIPGKPKPFSCRPALNTDQCGAFAQSYSLRLPPRLFWEDQCRENGDISFSPFCQGDRKKQLGGSSSFLEAKKQNEEMDQNKRALTRIKKRWRFSSLVQKKTRPWATNAYQCLLKKMRFGHSSSRKF